MDGYDNIFWETAIARPQLLLIKGSNFQPGHDKITHRFSSVAPVCFFACKITFLELCVILLFARLTYIRKIYEKFLALILANELRFSVSYFLPFSL